ncbi:MAG: histidine kinase [Chitinophagaceae bacterium]|jgi:two-component sensor histidine kinase
MKFTLLFVLCFIGFSRGNLKVFAQEFPAQHFDLESGLPSNTIYDVYEDENGLIWIGTNKGIARYNGRKFEIFTTANGLSDNECFFFRKDYQGRLWLTTYNGELCYYKDGIFHTAENTPFLRLNSKASLIVVFKVQSDSSITFVLHDDPGFFEIKNDKITYYSSPLMTREFSQSTFRYINKTENRDIEIYYSNHKIIYDNEKKTYRLVPYDNGLRFKKAPPYNDNDICLQNDTAFYTSNMKKLELRDKALLRNISLNKIYNINGLIIGVTNRGVIFDGIARFLQDNEINSLTKDQFGNYWICTARDGIFKFSKNFLEQARFPLNIKRPVIHAYRSNHEIFYTTNDRNIYSLNLKTGMTKSIFDFTTVSNKAPWVRNVSWNYKNAYYNFSDDINLKIAEINFISGPKISKIKGGHVLGSYQKFDAGRFIFLNSTHQFYFYDKADLESGKDTIKLHYLIKNFKYKIYGAAVDEKNHLWFSFSNGTHKVVDTTVYPQKQFKHYGFREIEFLNGTMVAVTPKNKLLVFENYEDDRIRSRSLENGNCVWDKFYKINDTSMLVSTNDYCRILTISNVAGKRSISLRALENPLIPFQFDYILIDSTHCYFFKKDELKVFPISFLMEKAPLPRLILSSIKTINTSVIIKDTVNLKYEEAQNIRILFTSVSSHNSELTYEYSITTDREKEVWYPIQGEELNFARLNFGLYHIKLRSKTDTGNYSNPASFYLLIVKPFWATWWFIGFCILLFVLLILGIIVRIIKFKLKKKEFEVRFLKSEYKALNALMNPHFIFNSLNSVQGLVNSKEIVSANKYIRIFSDLIRQNMQNIASELISLQKEIEFVENYIKIEQLRLNNTLHYRITIQENLDIDSIKIPPLLIQPLVENAIKHGIWPNETCDGFLEIEVYEKESILYISVTDNGNGLAFKQQTDSSHQSYAIRNIQKRLDHLSKIHKVKIDISITEKIEISGTVSGVISLVSIENKLYY